MKYRFQVVWNFVLAHKYAPGDSALQEGQENQMTFFDWPAIMIDPHGDIKKHLPL
jgi:hypothetical protein